MQTVDQAGQAGMARAPRNCAHRVPTGRYDADPRRRTNRWIDLSPEQAAEAFRAAARAAGDAYLIDAEDERVARTYS